MRHREKTKTKSAYRIVSDPFAPEEEWVDAALSLPAVVKPNSRLSVVERARKVSSARNVAALTVMTVSSVFLVRAGYDWGYKIIDLCVGQERALSQGIMANFSVPHMVFPVCLGILVAGRLAGSHATRLKWVLALSLLAATAWDFLVDDDIFFRAAEIAFAGSTGIAAYCLTRINRVRLRISSLTLPALWNLPVLVTLSLCAGIASFCSTEHRFPIEILAYSFAIARVAYLSRTNAAVGKLEFENALLVLSPLFVCNALNVVLNIISLMLDQLKFGADLGVRALASALLINAVAYCALWIGLKVPKKITV